MKTIKNYLFYLFLFIIIFPCCIKAPSAKSQVRFYTKSNTTPNNAWKAIMKFINHNGLNEITRDKKNGLIVFRFKNFGSEYPIYVNIHLRKKNNKDISISFIPRNELGTVLHKEEVIKFEEEFFNYIDAILTNEL
jgi:hypothetical protein